ncbi:sugar transferase [Leptolyngbya sp. FACHB-261]|uniref:sugar transferase n=1 Tax=Leptolyngbya sp. FACHB-261 TaxID=2692806 RepID=UPI00168A0504|nr:sugar transferase [Leptolyngbya sp. FACHB-261]MBD2101547.1 sugar transferase [Leptolyngbya sp. FACHB-261]
MLPSNRQFPASEPSIQARGLDIRRANLFVPWQLSGQGLRVAALMFSDIFGLSLAWKLAGHFNKSFMPPPSELVWWDWFGLPSPFWIFAAVTLILFGLQRFYTAGVGWRDYVKQGQVISSVYLFSLVVSYFYDPKLDAPRSLFFTAWFSSIALVVGLRLLMSLVLRQIQIWQLRSGQTAVANSVPVFLLVSPERLSVLSSLLHRRTDCRVVGAAPSSTANTAKTIQAILNSGASEVLAEQLPEVELASVLYWQLRNAGIRLRLVPTSLVMLHRRGAAEVFAGLPTVRVEMPVLGGLDYGLKRLLDQLCAFLAVILLAPLFLVVAVAIRLDSPGSIFFCQERVGLKGQSFQMWKFRTMLPNAASLQAQLEARNESGDGVLFKIKNDPRVTRLGRFLRRTSLDELPQLFNVLLGQMSLVGPRPLPVRDVERFESWHHTRHQVLPGITGLWQVSGRSDLDDFNDVARLDLFYIDNWSLNLDLDILVETVRIVLFGKGAY